MNKKKRIKKYKTIFRRELEWLNRGVKARRKRNEKRKENVISLKSSYKEANSQFLKSISKVKLPDSSFEVTESPNILINFINVHKRFIQEKKETLILKDFSFKLMRGDWYYWKKWERKVYFFKFSIRKNCSQSRKYKN